MEIYDIPKELKEAIAEHHQLLDKEQARDAIEKIVNHGNKRDMKIRNYLFKELEL